MLSIHSTPRASAVKQPSNIMVLLENQLVDSALHHVMTCFANLKMGFRANNIEAGSMQSHCKCTQCTKVILCHKRAWSVPHFFHNFGWAENCWLCSCAKYGKLKLASIKLPFFPRKYQLFKGKSPWTFDSLLLLFLVCRQKRFNANCKCASYQWSILSDNKNGPFDFFISLTI